MWRHRDIHASQGEALLQWQPYCFFPSPWDEFPGDEGWYPPLTSCRVVSCASDNQGLRLMVTESAHDVLTGGLLKILSRFPHDLGWGWQPGLLRGSVGSGGLKFVVFEWRGSSDSVTSRCLSWMEPEAAWAQRGSHSSESPGPFSASRITAWLSIHNWLYWLLFWFLY